MANGQDALIARIQRDLTNGAVTNRAFYAKLRDAIVEQGIDMDAIDAEAARKTRKNAEAGGWGYSPYAPERE